MAKLKVRLQRKLVDGRTVFTSADVPGLYAAHKDAAFARAHVEESIRSLQRARKEDATVDLEIVEPGRERKAAVAA